MSTEETATTERATVERAHETALQRAREALCFRNGELAAARAFAQGTRAKIAATMETVPGFWHNGEGIKCVELYGSLAALREMNADFPRVEKLLIEQVKSAQDEYDRLRAADTAEAVG